MAKQGKRVKAKKHKPKINRKKLVIGIVVGVLAFAIYTQIAHYTKQARLEKELDQQTKALQLKIKELNSTSESAKQRQKQIEALQKELEQKSKELQAKRENQARAIAESSQAVSKPQVSGAVAPVSSNEAKMFIYNHESGNRTTAVNSIGCRGLGQACPGTKLPCGDDYACQDAWFTNYMLQRYGSWENARAFWLSHRWW